MIGWLLARAWPLAAALGVSMLGLIGGQAYTIRGMKLEAAQLVIKARDEADKRGRELAAEQGRIVDALLEKNQSTALERDAVSDRLRKLTANRSQLAATCAGSDEAPAALISDERREAFLAEARRADEVVHQLTAAQAEILATRKACTLGKGRD